MYFEFINIGPIDNVKIDLNSDLTFVYGKNSIGKSYVITIVYLILKNISSVTPFVYRSFLSYYSQYYDTENVQALLGKLHDMADSLDITEEVKTFITEFISAVFVNNLETSLTSSYGSIANLSNKITNKIFHIVLHFSKYDLDIFESNNHLKLEIVYQKSITCKKVKSHRFPKTDDDSVKMYYFGENEVFQNDLLQFTMDFFRDGYLEVKDTIAEMYFLPASRSGVYRALNAFSQILAELSKKRSFVHQKIVLPSISEQDSDYFSMINDINIKRINRNYNDIASKIEQNLLNGTVSFNQKTKQILFHPNNSNISMELLGTSSMIAEISPIVLFLRYIITADEERKRMAGGKPVIFIEEPEAHLHPENQVKLTEYFTDIIKAGAKIVITSHSNYIFNKLNNLIAGKLLSEQEVSGYLLKNSERGSRSEKIKQSSLGFEDNNFVDVSELLYNEKLRIIDNLENDN